MGITFEESTGIFHLRAGGASYVMRLTAERDVLHLHWGEAIEKASIGYIFRPVLRAFSPSTHPDNPDMSYDTLPLEYPFYGSGDFRSPAFGVRFDDGTAVVEPKYRFHAIRPGKPRLEARSYSRSRTGRVALRSSCAIRRSRTFRQSHARRESSAANAP